MSCGPDEQMLQAAGLPVPGLDELDELERKLAGGQKQNSSRRESGGFADIRTISL